MTIGTSRVFTRERQRAYSLRTNCASVISHFPRKNKPDRHGTINMKVNFSSFRWMGIFCEGRVWGGGGGGEGAGSLTKFLVAFFV